MNNITKCPLCDTRIRLKYKKITSKNKNTENTHIWSCPNCPFVGFEYYTNKNIKDLKKYLNKTPHCLYCNKKRPSKHFCCEICEVGMCDDCYDNMKEHDDHYHEICESCDEKECKLIIEKIGYEPAYICNKCLEEITKPITI